MNDAIAVIWRGNPWTLDERQCMCLEALALTAERPDAAALLDLSLSAIDARLSTARSQMGAVNTMQAVLMWDRWHRDRAEAA